jgi:glycine hydroxymethyltransferase
MKDNKIWELYQKEINRQQSSHNFIASENYVSDEVLEITGSEFTNKYTEGYPYKRYYNGCENYDELEVYGIELLQQLFGCNFANLQPHSGANANLAVFKAFLSPGDTILGMDLSAGGHLSHGSNANISGKWFDNHFYGVDDNGFLNYDEIEMKAVEVKPKMLIAGASAYPRQIDWQRFRQIADKVGAILLIDMSHYSGLIAAGVYDNPIPYGDVITSTTHKTLRGARGGMILWNDEKWTKQINSAVFPGTQGGPLMNQIAGKIQSFSEANTDEFKKYGQDIIDNAKIMCQVFKENDITIGTDGTDSHIILIHTKETSGEEVANRLESEFNIVVNKNSIPNDPRGVWKTSGIRIGTAAMTTKRGSDVNYFKDIAEVISNVINNK